MSTTSKGSARFRNNCCGNTRAPQKCCPKCKKTGFDFNVVIETDDDKTNPKKASACSSCSAASSLGRLAKNAVDNSVTIAKHGATLAKSLTSSVIEGKPLAKNIISSVIGVTGAIGALMDFPTQLPFSSSRCPSQPPNRSCNRDSGSCSSKSSQCSDTYPRKCSKASGELPFSAKPRSCSCSSQPTNLPCNRDSGIYSSKSSKCSNYNPSTFQKASGDNEVDIQSFNNQYTTTSCLREPDKPSLLSSSRCGRDSTCNSPFKRCCNEAPTSVASEKPLSKWGQRRWEEKRRSSLNYVLETDVIGSRRTSEDRLSEPPNIPRCSRTSRRTSEDRLSEPPNIPRCSQTDVNRMSKKSSCSRCSISSLPRRHSDGGSVRADNTVVSDHLKSSIGLRKCIARKCLIPSQQRGCRSSSQSPEKCSRYSKQGCRYIGQCTSQESIASDRSPLRCTRPCSNRHSSSASSSKDDFDEYIRLYKTRSGYGLGERKSSLLMRPYINSQCSINEFSDQPPQPSTSNDLECEIVKKCPCASPEIECKLVPVQCCKLAKTRCPCDTCQIDSRSNSMSSSRSRRRSFECHNESLSSCNRPSLNKNKCPCHQISEQATDIRRDSTKSVAFERPTEFVFNNGRFTDARSLKGASQSCENGQCKRTCTNRQYSRKCGKCGKSES